MSVNQPVSSRPITVVHVTHEGVDHMGGIGTVLEGLMTSPVYQSAVGRSILVGPLPYADRRVRNPLERLGDYGVSCKYSGPEHHDPEGLGAILQPIEWAFGVKLVYGTRRFEGTAGGAGGGRTGEADVLLVDVNNPDRQRLAAFKWTLYEKFGLDSHRYESGWDYEEWCRLAEPAYHALVALLPEAELPAVLISHEFMGVATALRASLDRKRFRTVFHAHECSTARRIVENLAGHDVAFYPAMRDGMARGQHVAQVFGDQSDFSRHALVSNTHRLDAVLAVGPETAEELRFLSPAMEQGPVRIAYNGLPTPRVSLEQKRASRARVMSWVKKVVGFEPDYLFTHVTRPVPSKGLWRDQKIGAHLEQSLRRAGKRGVYLLLTCGAEPRSFEQVCAMARDYGWPMHHREGYPDLTGPESGIYRAMTHFVEHARRDAGGDGHLVPLLVNQFGFTRQRLGESAPEGLSMADLRSATDAELGLSIYEPFGIAHLEALHAGAICLPSTVCGCLGLVKRAMAELGLTEATCPIVLAGDFTHEAVADPLRLTAHERDLLEERVCKVLAEELWSRLPKSEADRERYLSLGQRLAERMGWDAVCASDFVPALRAALRGA
jgi:glycosyltransferase involved in cell wall biosynthesis